MSELEARVVPTRGPLYPVALWGVLGFCLLLTNAIVRLTPLAIAPIEDGTLSAMQIGLYIVWVVWMVWSEGYRAFQKQLSPRVVARAMWLARNPRPLFVVFAPLFCMSLFYATRKRLITSWAILTGIVGLIVAVRQLDQPWRGIVDGGVVLGLAWGLTTILIYLVIGLTGRPMPVPPELPDGAPS